LADGVLPDVAGGAAPVVDFLGTGSRGEHCGSEGDCYSIQLFHDFPFA
jgi:hypothetical protein